MQMAKAVTIYGIKNCDTMKKARPVLDIGGELLVGFKAEHLVREPGIHNHSPSLRSPRRDRPIPDWTSRSS